MGSAAAVRALPRVDDDELYPCSDGKPVGETDYHIASLMYLRGALNFHFRDQPRVYVAADMFLYYEEGNPLANISPDIMVIKGVSKRLRRSFKLWEEKAGPRVIFELISRASRGEDLNVKPPIYARLGVAEYFIYDPEGLSLQPRLMGFRRKKSRFVPMRLEPDGGLTSSELGLRLIPEHEILRLVDVKTGRPLPTADELASQFQEAQRKLEDLQAKAAKRVKGKKPPKNGHG